MAGDTGDPEDRTEAPTQRRLDKARDDGQLPVSREAVMLAGLAGATIGLLLWRDEMGQALTQTLTDLLRHPDMTAREPFGLFRQLAIAFLMAIAPVVLPIALAATAATLAQTRLATKTWTIEAGRLSPAKGLKRMFGSESLVETARSLAKLLIDGGAAWFILRREFPLLGRWPSAPLSLMPKHLSGLVLRLLIAVVLAQTVVAAADMLWLWRKHLRQMRMSRTDIKDEQKETDGDPAIKMRIRRVRMQRARQRMLAAVPAATVIVTNPTHYAVALTYDSQKGSIPRLVAKGVDSMAARIRETAGLHGVPIVANPPLARALHQLPLNARIPPEMYKAVAELIAYVWRLHGRQSS